MGKHISQEQQDATSKTFEEELEYYAIVLFGSTTELREFTASSLYTNKKIKFMINNMAVSETLKPRCAFSRFALSGHITRIIRKMPQLGIFPNLLRYAPQKLLICANIIQLTKIFN